MVCAYGFLGAQWAVDCAEIQAVKTLKEGRMGVNWSKDIDEALSAVKERSRPILLDFSAAPA